MSIYLDYNASSPIEPRVLSSMIDAYQNHIGNPDSRTHNYGDDARSQIEKARHSVSSLLGVQKDEVYFTSGATESNNIAVLGLKEYGLKTGCKHIITSSIEHKAILEATKYLEKNGFEIEYIDPNQKGIVTVDSVLSRVRNDTLLVSIMHVNNETGIIQPVNLIGENLEKTGTLFHIDATQSAGKLVSEIRELKYDMLSLSAHKMYGPQGVGGLILRKKNYRLPPVKPIMFGGAQEHGIRPGTLPTALIIGFGKACEIADNEYINNEKKCKKVKQELINLLKSNNINFVINGDPNFCISNTLNISFLGISSEALMLSTRAYCSVSNGSACNSSSYELSHVLSAMSLPKEQIESAIRISWGPDVNLSVLQNDFLKLLDIVKQLA